MEKDQVQAVVDQAVNDNSSSKASTDEVVFTADQQEHVNRLIAQAKSKAKDEAERAHKKEIKEALKKQKDYATLSEEERERQELEDAKKQFEAQKKDFEYRHLLLEVRQDLAEKALPASFAEFLTVEGDSEQSLKNVVLFKKTFDRAVAEQVKSSLKNPPPQEGTGSRTTGVSLGERLAKQGTSRTTRVFED